MVLPVTIDRAGRDGFQARDAAGRIAGGTTPEEAVANLRASSSPASVVAPAAGPDAWRAFVGRAGRTDPLAREVLAEWRAEVEDHRRQRDAESDPTP